MSVAIVTGGGRGIGRVIAKKLAEEGYDVAICYAGNEEAAKETVAACEEAGVRAFAKKTDVSNVQEIKEFVTEVKNSLGAPEVLINNAGITRDSLLISMKEEDLDAVLDTNLKGAISFTKEVLRDMMRAKNGRIINISSIVGLNGNAGQSAYAATKAGLVGFTKSVAKEYGAKGIRCNAVAPGFIETEMTASLPEDVKKGYLNSIPLARFGKPEDIADAVAFLVSDKASYITGQVLSVDGGM